MRRFCSLLFFPLFVLALGFVGEGSSVGALVAGFCAGFALVVGDGS